eukprot:651541-Lingulodinium_polyedra.AAC.1
MSTLASRKSPGGDSIVSELLSKHADFVSRFVAMVMAKSAWLLSEPVQWRGHSIAHLYKGEGCPAECASSRDISLGDVVGKIYHSHERRHL